MVVPFSQFGRNDYQTYLRYLRLEEEQTSLVRSYGGHGRVLAGWRRMAAGGVGQIAGGGGGDGSQNDGEASDVASACFVGAGLCHGPGGCPGGGETRGIGGSPRGAVGCDGAGQRDGGDRVRADGSGGHPGGLSQVGGGGDPTGVGSADSRVSSGVTVAARGPNYERNRERRQRAKASRAARVGRGTWAGCSDQVRQELLDTRARRLVAENVRATERATVDTEKIRRMREAGVFERQCAVEKEVLEGQLSGRFSLVPPSRVSGWAKTVVSGSSSSSASSTGRSCDRSDRASSPVSVGSASSVSPSSSVSENERRLEKTVAELERKVAKMESSASVVTASGLRSTPQNDLITLLSSACDGRVLSVALNESRRLAVSRGQRVSY